jgi:hypothetical protein
MWPPEKNLKKSVLAGTFTVMSPFVPDDAWPTTDKEHVHMQVEQLFVETLIDMNKRLSNNPSEYDLLRVSGLLRQILIDKKNLLDNW